MDPKRLVTVSKFLSKHLRHAPERLGLTLAHGGWVDVDELLAGCAREGFPIRLAELKEVVARNDKQRFSFDESGTRIRANQGHSTAVDLQLEPATPPAVLYHGTPEKSVEQILRTGLKKMSRHHVHLSPTVPTAQAVGARRGRPVIVAVDAAGMARDGHTFYRSANGVWLVGEVPPQYLRLVSALPENEA
jgi:putative RNA 2'-phosphotransferase